MNKEYCQLCALDLHEPIERWPLSILERPYRGKHMICAAVDGFVDYMDARGGPVRASIKLIAGLFMLAVGAQIACNVLLP